jgi:hypothetical protein
MVEGYYKSMAKFAPANYRGIANACVKRSDGESPASNGYREVRRHLAMQQFTLGICWRHPPATLPPEQALTGDSINSPARSFTSPAIADHFG